MTTSKENILYLMRKLYGFLSIRRKRQLILLLITMLTSSITEFFTLISILPFLKVLIEPQLITDLPILNNFLKALGLLDQDKFLLFFTIIFMFMAILAAIVRLTNIWLSTKIAGLIGADFSFEAFRRTLYQPYNIHINRNNSYILATTTTMINTTAVAIDNLLTLVTLLVIGISLFIGLLIINWKITCASTLIFCTVYIFISFKIQNILNNNSKIVTESKIGQLKRTKDSLDSIREILLNGTQKYYLDRFSKTERLFRGKIAENNFFANFPRFAIEAIGLVLITFLAYLLTNKDGGEKVLPLIGTMALGIQRLLPIIQGIYSSWAQTKSSSKDINQVITLLNQPISQVSILENKKGIDFREKIVLKDVSFKYSNNEKEILENINITIKKGERIGIIGQTGSGKSTLVDILMGLIEPTKGKLIVDSKEISEKSNPRLISNCRMILGHVPQNIFLSDSTIQENIAMGVPLENIDMKKVIKAARQAQLMDFIESKPYKFKTKVGEKGIKLSGGQRQRIAIARSLYRDKKILFFDEATNALDIKTESNILKAIKSLSKDLTIIIITHRPESLSYCDQIIEIKNKTAKIKIK